MLTVTLLRFMLTITAKLSFDIEEDAVVFLQSMALALRPSAPPCNDDSFPVLKRLPTDGKPGELVITAESALHHPPAIHADRRCFSVLEERGSTVTGYPTVDVRPMGSAKTTGARLTALAVHTRSDADHSDKDKQQKGAVFQTMCPTRAIVLATGHKLENTAQFVISKAKGTVTQFRASSELPGATLVQTTDSGVNTLQTRQLTEGRKAANQNKSGRANVLVHLNNEPTKFVDEAHEVTNALLSNVLPNTNNLCVATATLPGRKSQFFCYSPKMYIIRYDCSFDVEVAFHAKLTDGFQKGNSILPELDTAYGVGYYEPSGQKQAAALQVTKSMAGAVSRRPLNELTLGPKAKDAELSSYLSKAPSRDTTNALVFGQKGRSSLDPHVNVLFTSGAARKPVYTALGIELKDEALTPGQLAQLVLRNRDGRRHDDAGGVSLVTVSNRAGSGCESTDLVPVALEALFDRTADSVDNFPAKVARLVPGRFIDSINANRYKLSTKTPAHTPSRRYFFTNGKSQYFRFPTKKTNCGNRFILFSFESGPQTQIQTPALHPTASERPMLPKKLYLRMEPAESQQRLLGDLDVAIGDRRALRVIAHELYLRPVALRPHDFELVRR